MGNQLAELARPVLERVRDEVRGTPFSLLLADESATIIDRHVGDRRLRSVLDRVRLSRGHGWGERYVGTNAIGTALGWMAPIIVCGPEHFADALAAVTCAAATISDPRTGQLVGAIGLASAVEDASVLMLPYVCRVGREIERSIRR